MHAFDKCMEFQALIDVYFIAIVMYDLENKRIWFP